MLNLVVPQTRVTSALDIYNTLADDSTFMSYVGDYTFKGGSTSTALSIITPGKALPNLGDVQGLEVIIHDAGRAGRIDYLTNPSDALITYQVYLLLWEPANGDTLNNASTRIIEAFSGTNVLQIVPIKENKNILVQSLAEIPNNAAIMI